MKVLVAVKRVVDFRVKVRVKNDGSGVDIQHVAMSVNPFDEIALEEAIRLKEQGIANEVLVVSIGTNQCQETLRAGLAMGADRALLVETDANFEPLNIAKILVHVCQQEQPSLVILGKQAIDDDCNQTGQMLAGLMNWSQGTFISKLSVDLGQQTLLVTREIDGGLENLQLHLPAVLTTDLRLNQPRYTSLPNIMKAKQKPLHIQPLHELGLQLITHIETVRVDAPPERKPGIKVKDINELMSKLKLDTKVPA